MENRPTPSSCPGMGEIPYSGGSAFRLWAAFASWLFGTGIFTERSESPHLLAAEAMLQHVVAPLVDLEVKSWRNAAYENVCHLPVPEVEPSFSPSIFRINVILSTGAISEQM